MIERPAFDGSANIQFEIPACPDQVYHIQCFLLIKTKKFFRDITFKEEFDLIYFDAFGARVQPELWTEPIFKIMYYALKRNGILVTYSAKGSAKRAMESSGFDTEKLDGPPGKRHMIRATKN